MVPSTVGFSTTKRVRMSTALPSHIEQMIKGLLLSDGYLRYGKGSKNASLHNQLIPYFVQAFSLLSHYYSFPLIFCV
jgi:hypothetical protein